MVQCVPFVSEELSSVRFYVELAHAKDIMRSEKNQLGSVLVFQSIQARKATYANTVFKSLA